MDGSVEEVFNKSGERNSTVDSQIRLLGLIMMHDHSYDDDNDGKEDAKDATIHKKKKLQPWCQRAEPIVACKSC